MNETYAYLYHEDAFRPWVAAPEFEVEVVVPPTTAFRIVR